MAGPGHQLFVAREDALLEEQIVLEADAHVAPREDREGRHGKLRARHARDDVGRGWRQLVPHVEQILQRRGDPTVDAHHELEVGGFQLVMGVDGGIPATLENLLHMRNQLPPTATYVVAGMARTQLPMTTLAILTGGHVRVGLEDNLFLKKGVLARNEELVARARHLADDLQREVATPQEAPRIMALSSEQAGTV